tara:strand:- start:457 stop:1371 length:915 start_codon:yes stop_codon:yes gene_type:complete
MTALAEIENQAKLCRITCGWKKQELPIDWVRLYWRDVHSPAIARRDGIYDYRHYQYDNIMEELLPKIDGVEKDCDVLKQIMWTSDVRYLDDEHLKIFDNSPTGLAKQNLLGDIDLIVDKSTTYRTVNENGHTFIDNSGISSPQGSCAAPTFSLFIRKNTDEENFREFMTNLCKTWSQKIGVVRLRLSLLDAPDMEKERLAGYPVKTHTLETQYQAWIDITVDSQQRMGNLIGESDNLNYANYIKALHLYPVRAIYTSVYQSLPTLVGVRGYPAYQAISALNAENQKESPLLEWMYGPIAKKVFK